MVDVDYSQSPMKLKSCQARFCDALIYHICNFAFKEDKLRIELLSLYVLHVLPKQLERSYHKNLTQPSHYPTLEHTQYRVGQIQVPNWPQDHTIRESSYTSSVVKRIGSQQLLSILLERSPSPDHRTINMLPQKYNVRFQRYVKSQCNNIRKLLSSCFGIALLGCAGNMH